MEHPIAAAQARRDRARLIASKQRITGLQDAIREFTDIRSWRITAPLRAALAVLRGQPVPATVPASAAPTLDTGSLRALVIDDHWPQPDRDAGSMEIVTLVEGLAALGYEVTFAADLEHDGPSQARRALAVRGVRCLGPADAPSVSAFIEQETPFFDLCVLCRAFCGGKFLEAVRAHRSASRIVFNTIDLTFLRVQRQAALGGSFAPEVVQAVRAREEAVIAGSDATMVVSGSEQDLLRSTMPDSLVIALPLARAVTPPVTGFAERRGIGFIGGFAHAPNVDAVRWFTSEIWPLVLRDDPGCELEIVGADMPADLLAGVPGLVRALGHLPDVGPWFEQLRLTVAPLRFGAGAKGKVASSLAAGVPCVATTIAAEGMALRPGDHVLVADKPEDFAAGVHRAYHEIAVWEDLSRAGLAYAAETLSKARWQAQLAAMLQQIGL